MCQLTFVNFNHRTPNQQYVLIQWWINGKTQNRDGFGIFSNGKIFKSAIDVNKVVNFGTCLKTGITGGPVIAHIRAATAVKSVKTVDDESSHPFETKKLVLAHNGSLDFKDPKEHDKYKTFTVDSEIFLQILDELYDGTNFVDAMQKAMDKFNGPFAFLIYSKLEGKYFAVKGDTKKLHLSLVTIHFTSGEEDRSIVLNTDAWDMDEGLNRFKAITELAEGVRQVEYTKPVELEKNSIFEINTLNDTIARIGEIKETAKVYTQNFTQTGYQGWNRTAQTKSTTGDKNTTGTNTLLTDLTWYLSELGLTFIEFDAELVSVYGHGIFYATAEEVKDLIEASYAGLSSAYTNTKFNLWEGIKEYFVEPMEIYQSDTRLRFPYMLNNEKMLSSFLSMLQGEKK